MHPNYKNTKYLGFDALNAHLAKSSFETDEVETFPVVKPFGEGAVHCIELSKGLLILQFDMLLHSGHTLILDSEETDVVHFMYCQAGTCFHQQGTSRDQTEIVEKQTAVVVNGVGTSSRVHIEKGEPLKLNIIRMDRRWYQSRTNSEIVPELFGSPEKCLNGFHAGQFNLEIGDLVKRLGHSKGSNVISEHQYFKGLCHLIVAHQIEQFSLQETNCHKRPTNLLQRELQQIVELTEFVENYPEVQHCVTSLCSKSGLSAAKLQQGFKFIHEQTVGEFIRNVRLKRSEIYLRTTEMNISEVVYSIGFTSRSYFCKIFKARYGCSPKKYKRAVLGSSLERA